jgi:hypothetical protein
MSAANQKRPFSTKSSTGTCPALSVFGPTPTSETAARKGFHTVMGLDLVIASVLLSALRTGPSSAPHVQSQACIHGE